MPDPRACLDRRRRRQKSSLPPVGAMYITAKACVQGTRPGGGSTSKGGKAQIIGDNRDESRGQRLFLAEYL